MRTIWQPVLALFLLLTGMLAVAQWRAERPLRAQTELPSHRVLEVALLLRHQEEAIQALEAEVQRLRERIQEYQQAIAEGQGAAEAMARELEYARLVQGLVPVEGPGVIVRLARREPVGILAVQARADDLAGLVNELWAAGAEAIAVNGIRVLATTGFRDGPEGTILAGQRPVQSPLTIEAIGEPLTLQGALNIRGGFVEGLRSIGLRVAVERHERLSLPAHRDPHVFRHARPRSGP